MAIFVATADAAPHENHDTTRPEEKGKDPEQEPAANESREGVTEQAEVGGAGFMAEDQRSAKKYIQMTLIRKHPRLVIAAAIMPTLMIIGASIEGHLGNLLFFAAFFSLMISMLVTRMRGLLPMAEFMAVGGIMLAIWVILVFVRAAIYGYLGKPL